MQSQKLPIYSIVINKIYYKIRSHNIFPLLFFVLVLTLLSGCNRSTRSFFHEGVSKELARYRARQIYDVNYQLHFHIPDNKDEAVTGNAKILFKPLKARHGVILDFVPGEDFIHSIRVNNDSIGYMIMNGHIYIDADGLIPRQENVIEISFTASDQALNRSDDFMYTLFVPDRASTAFPCFDQPDLKAGFQLSLDIPGHWTALSNGSEINQEELNDRKSIHFASDNPISTYLFAFTAGVFDVISETQNGRTLRIFHRETDPQKLALNLQTIFDHHFSALQWLESYTTIPYPYHKLDMALLPGFQYSGMEHPGAIWYRDTRLLLDANPSITNKMRKASLIAHETAHMWFGNLVTMQWFDDVWLKEVFAGFMADKIIAEQFPEENHKLQFVLSHYPRAMSIDRTQGTHPIKQTLTNMKLAGTLYGPIIYNKAPIVFEQLEQIMQPANFRSAITEYLLTYAHGNADWKDLVNIFDKYSSQSISSWSDAWIYGKGLPHIGYTLNHQNPAQITIQQVSHKDDKNFPAQFLGVNITGQQNNATDQIWFDKRTMDYSPEVNVENPLLILLNGLGKGYGYFELNPSDINFIRESMLTITDETYLSSGQSTNDTFDSSDSSYQTNEFNRLFSDASTRAAIYINLYENFLHSVMDSETYYQCLIHSIRDETNQPLQNHLLNNLRVWAFNFPDFRNNRQKMEEVENLLWEKLENAPSTSAGMFFDHWLKLAYTPQSSYKMRGLYLGTYKAGDLKLSDDQYSQLALEASLRNEMNSDLPALELKRITNPDRIRRFQYILPTISTNKTERDNFFEGLKAPSNRNPEPWVLEALYFLHHPMHPEQGLGYIQESLDLLPEIQITGDIFFPQNWLAAIFENYSNSGITDMVHTFLGNNPELEENLKLKLLQASDIIQRSANQQ